ITDPRHDPESRYRVQARGFAAVLGRLQSTLLGQMVFGPAISVGRFFLQESRRLACEPARVVRDWAPHLVAVALVLWWLDHVGLGVGRYVLC
ncbi:hypothetical protein AB2C63_32355, partial [Pseudomonas aeruginosa]